MGQVGRVPVVAKSRLQSPHCENPHQGRQEAWGTCSVLRHATHTCVGQGQVIIIVLSIYISKYDYGHFFFLHFFITLKYTNNDGKINMYTYMYMPYCGQILTCRTLHVTVPLTSLSTLKMGQRNNISGSCHFTRREQQRFTQLHRHQYKA